MSLSRIEIAELRSSIQMARASVGAAVVMAQRLGVTEIELDAKQGQQALLKADERLDAISKADQAQVKMNL